MPWPVLRGALMKPVTIIGMRPGQRLLGIRLSASLSLSACHAAASTPSLPKGVCVSSGVSPMAQVSQLVQF
jgi:hypothetical protein